MESVIHALILGLVQGLTEFLPVSSSGHLVVVRSWLGWPDEGLAFDAALHLGTLVAVVVVFRSTVVELLQGRNRPLFGAIVLGTIPAAVAGLIVKPLVADRFRGAAFVGAMFLVTAVILAVAERRARTPRRETPPWTLGPALVVGVAQMFTLVPGLSRSGLTIAAGLLAGWSRARAVEFSFLLSIPITAAAGLEGVRGVRVLSADDLLALGISTVTAFAAGVVALAYFWRAGRARSLSLYVWYLTALGLLVIVGFR